MQKFKKKKKRRRRRETKRPAFHETIVYLLVVFVFIIMFLLLSMLLLLLLSIVWIISCCLDFVCDILFETLRIFRSDRHSWLLLMFPHSIGHREIHITLLFVCLFVYLFVFVSLNVCHSHSSCCCCCCCRVRVHCVVSINNLLDRCQVISNNPSHTVKTASHLFLSNTIALFGA